MKRNNEDKKFDAINYIFMIAVIIITLYPFYYVLIMSFNQGIDATRGGIYFWPRVFSLENYQKLMGEEKWVNGLLISVMRTLIGTGLGVLFTSIVAYGLSHKGLLFKKTYFVLLIFAMHFSGGLIPYYVLLRNVGLLNKFWVYVIPRMLDMFLVMIMISFFREIPEEIKESAWIDGANDLKIFVRIILPVSKPAVATISLFLAVDHWNSWLDSAYFVFKPELRTLSYHMMEVINKSMLSKLAEEGSFQEANMAANTVTTTSLKMASIIIAVAPIILVYPFLQKYFVKGIMLGSVKG